MRIRVPGRWSRKFSGTVEASRRCPREGRPTQPEKHESTFSRTYEMTVPFTRMGRRREGAAVECDHALRSDGLFLQLEH